MFPSAEMHILEKVFIPAEIMRDCAHCFDDFYCYAPKANCEPSWNHPVAAILCRSPVTSRTEWGKVTESNKTRVPPDGVTFKLLESIATAACSWFEALANRGSLEAVEICSNLERTSGGRNTLKSMGCAGTSKSRFDQYILLPPSRHE